MSHWVALGRRANLPTTQMVNMESWAADLRVLQRWAGFRPSGTRLAKEDGSPSARLVARTMSLKGYTCVLLCPFRYPTSSSRLFRRGLDYATSHAAVHFAAACHSLFRALWLSLLVQKTELSAGTIFSAGLSR